MAKDHTFPVFLTLPLERRFRLHHCNCYCHHQSHHKLFSGLFNHQILAGLLLLCHQDQSAFHPNSTEMSKGRKVLCVLCPVCSPFPHHQCLMPHAPRCSHFSIWSDAWPVSLILFLVSFLQPLFLTNPSLHLCSMDFYWCLVSSEYLCPPLHLWQLSLLFAQSHTTTGPMGVQIPLNLSIILMLLLTTPPSFWTCMLQIFLKYR